MIGYLAKKAEILTKVELMKYWLWTMKLEMRKGGPSIGYSQTSLLRRYVQGELPRANP